MPMIVATAVAGSVTVLNGTFMLVQNGYKLAAVDEDLAICLELLDNAERDLNYARRQLSSRQNSRQTSFSATDFAYFERCIHKVDDAALSLGKLVQGYRVQRNVKNGISITSRFKWVMQGKDKFANRQEVLRMAHTSLVGCIQRLGNVSPNPHSYSSQYSPPPPPYNPPSTYPQSYPQSYSQSYSPSYSQTQFVPPLQETKILRSPSQQRALRGKSSMLLRPEDRPKQGTTVTISEIRNPDQAPVAPSLASLPRDRELSRATSRARYGSYIDSVAEESEFGEYMGSY